MKTEPRVPTPEELTRYRIWAESECACVGAVDELCVHCHDTVCEIEPMFERTVAALDIAIEGLRKTPCSDPGYIAPRNAPLVAVECAKRTTLDPADWCPRCDALRRLGETP